MKTWMSRTTSGRDSVRSISASSLSIFRPVLPPFTPRKPTNARKHPFDGGGGTQMPGRQNLNLKRCLNLGQDMTPS